jgi:hypothetical protein
MLFGWPTVVMLPVRIAALASATIPQLTAFPYQGSRS